MLKRDDPWPIEKELWQILERLCNTWLIIVAEPPHGTLPENQMLRLCERFRGNIIYSTPAENPHSKALLAAKKQSSYLWLLDPSSKVLSSLFFQFSRLQHSHFIATKFNDKESYWRRSLVSTELDWRYDQASQQWEPLKEGVSTAYLGDIQVEPTISNEQHIQHAIERKAELLCHTKERLATGVECINIAQCFEALNDNESAASWYHKGAQSSQDNGAIYAYCSYRYWCLIESLADSNQQAGKQQQWLEIFERWPDRAESLYRLAQVYIDSGNWEKAWSIVEIALEIPLPEDGLPFEEWIYRYGLFYQATQCAHARENYQNVLTYSVAAMRARHLPEPVGKQLYLWQSEAYAQLHSYLPISRDEKNHFVIIIPFRNCSTFLQNCINSLKVQSYRYFEVIFIDDASTDGGLRNCNLEEIPAYTILSREESRGAMSNQMDALQHHCDPSDIAVFLDGDDQLADDSVLEYLNTVYSQTGCWFTYGQFSFNESPIAAYARPILESESVVSLFLSGGFKFPIHMRTHRAGLTQELLKQDPNLECMKSKDGGFVQSASDVAHARAMMMITPRERIRYISKVLYRYNTHNPNSHFKSERRRRQFTEFVNIANKPELSVADAYSPFVLKHTQKTRLMAIMLPGANLDIITQLMQENELPHIQSMSKVEDIARFTPQNGLGNAAFTRAVLCEEQIKDYADFTRYIPRKNSYSQLGFDRPHIRTGLFFGEHHIVDGKFYAVLAIGEINIRPTEGLTLINQWMSHGKTSPTLIHPDALNELISADSRFDAYDVSLERTSIATAEDADNIINTLSERLDLKLEVYTQLLDRGDWDCMVMGIDELHDVGHLLWHFWDREHPLYDPANAAVRKKIKAIYQKVDGMIGQLHERAGPVPIALVGGTGMQPMGSLNSHLDGMLRIFESAYTGKTVPASTHKRNRLFYAQYIEPTSGGIRFNLKGREPNGKISEAEYEEVCQFLTKCFKEIQHHEDGKPVVSEILVSRDHFGVNKDSSYPDILCVWEPGSAYGTVCSDLLGSIDIEPKPNNVMDFRTGDHNGVAWAVFNDQARNYSPTEAPFAPHEMGEYFRNIIETFPGSVEKDS